MNIKRGLCALLVVSTWLAACSSGDDNDTPPAAPPTSTVSVELSETELRPGQLSVLRVSGSPTPTGGVEVFLLGNALQTHQIDPNTPEYSFVTPTVPDGEHVMEVLVDQTLFSLPVRVVGNDFGDLSPAEYTAREVDAFEAELQTLLEQDFPSGARDEISAALEDLENIDLTDLSEDELRLLSDFVAATLAPARNGTSAMASKNEDVKDIRVFPDFDIEECNDERNDFLSATALTVAGISFTAASFYSGAAGLVIGPLAGAAAIIGANRMETAALGIVEHCVANLGDAILAFAFVNHSKQSELADMPPKSLTSLELTRLEATSLSISRITSVDDTTLSIIEEDANRIRGQLIATGHRGKYEGGTGAANKSFLSFGRSLLAALDALFATDPAGRLASEFEFEFEFENAGVSVSIDRDQDLVTMTPELDNALSDQQGSLRMRDLTDGHVSSFDLTVVQISPHACPDSRPDASLCAGVPEDIIVTPDAGVRFVAESRYASHIRLTSQSLPGELAFDEQSGIGFYQYSGETGDENALHGQLTYRAVNGSGDSPNEVTLNFYYRSELRLTSPRAYQIDARETLNGQIEATRNASFELVTGTEFGELSLNADGRFSYHATPATGGYSQSFTVGIRAGEDYIEELISINVSGPGCQEYWGERVLGNWSASTVGQQSSDCPRFMRADPGGVGEYTGNCEGDFDQPYAINWRIEGTGAACYFHEEGFWHSGGFDGQTRDPLDENLNFFTYSKFESGRISRHYIKQ